MAPPAPQVDPEVEACKAPGAPPGAEEEAAPPRRMTTVPPRRVTTVAVEDTPPPSLPPEGPAGAVEEEAAPPPPRAEEAEGSGAERVGVRRASRSRRVGKFAGSEGFALWSASSLAFWPGRDFFGAQVGGGLGCARVGRPARNCRQGVEATCEHLGVSVFFRIRVQRASVCLSLKSTPKFKSWAFTKRGVL